MADVFGKKLLDLLNSLLYKDTTVTPNVWKLDLAADKANEARGKFKNVLDVLNRILTVEKESDGELKGELVLKPIDDAAFLLAAGSVTGDLLASDALVGGVATLSGVMIGGNTTSRDLVLSSGDVVTSAAGTDLTVRAPGSKDLVLGADGATKLKVVAASDVLSLASGVKLTADAGSDLNIQAPVGEALLLGANAGTFLTLDSDDRQVTFSSGVSLSIPSTSKIGLFGATVISQPSSTAAEAGGFVVSSGTDINHLSTHTGGVGTKAYTFGDVVKNLKELGVLASS